MFNLSFHRPKKDLCKTCEKFKNKECSDVDYKRHIQKKELVREEKNKDREKAVRESSYRVAIF